MISEPGAAMLDAKLFVSRLNGDFEDLYERCWDGVEWIWVNHGRPEGMSVVGTPGAAMLDSKLFVTVRDGSLWERVWTGERWHWTAHGRPADQPIVAGPGAAMLNNKFFVTTEPGNLWERHWRDDLGRWAWFDHGRPADTAVETAPGAAMLDSKFFVGTRNGHLFERHWNGARWAWQDHGKPPGTSVASAPGAAMMGRKCFVRSRNNHLYERYWDGREWVWVDHGEPPGTWVATAPGAAMMDSKLFVGAGDGRLFERHWDGRRWLWVDHGWPPGTQVLSAPSAAMMNSKLFVATRNGNLFERHWNGATWQWVDHGSALHDRAQHILGQPGDTPKVTIAVMGDGYTEDDLPHYRRQVDRLILGALRLDALASQQDKFRVVRIDLTSPTSGVRERRYNADGELRSETGPVSRLGKIPNGEWKRCWFDQSDFTAARIKSTIRRFAPEAKHHIVLVKSNQFGGCSSFGKGVATFTEGANVDDVGHELGHNLFALADEYTSDDKTFTGDSSPWANLSMAVDDWSTLKWADLVKPGAPVPADADDPPRGWDKERDVSAFEGGGGRFSRGLFRPVLRCRMNQNSPPWCSVCRRKIHGDLEPYG